jgi:hypothetical protein
MIPPVSATASLMQSAAELSQAPFVYKQLLAFHRGELADPHACAAVEERLRKDRRWQAHWESIRYLDLDRAAAVQDAADLAHFTADQATTHCKTAADSAGRVFETLLLGADEGSCREWNRHADGCVYCRRLRRHVHAQQQRRETGLPAGELLLRDWLLSRLYLPALTEATRRLGFEWTAQEPGSEGTSPAGGDTILNQDTHLDAPSRAPSKEAHEPH